MACPTAERMDSPIERAPPPMRLPTPSMIGPVGFGGSGTLTARTSAIGGCHGLKPRQGGRPLGRRSGLVCCEYRWAGPGVVVLGRLMPVVALPNQLVAHHPPVLVGGAIGRLDHG